jgi:CelD/BcsL family acetyltransferase involved in cellulose biosynthesis
MQVRAITSDAEFFGMREGWQRLIVRAPAANVFLTHAWLAAWWTHYGNGSSLRILAAYDGKELVGLAPLMLQEQRIAGFPILRRLAFIGTGVSDRFDILFVPGHERAVLSAMFSYLQGERWDTLDLHEIPEESITAKILRELADAARTPAELGMQSVCPAIDLPPDPAHYFAGLSKKLRSNLSYYERRLRTKHNLSVVIFSNGLCDDRDLHAFFQLYRKRFAENANARELLDGRFAALRQEAARRLATEGAFQLALLRVDGHEVAAEFSFIYRDTFYAYNSCHDPTWERHSVGSILRAHVVRRAIMNGCRRYDFLRGEEPYKYKWGATARRQIRIRIWRRSGTRRRLMLDGARWVRSVLPRVNCRLFEAF